MATKKHQDTTSPATPAPPVIVPMPEGWPTTEAGEPKDFEDMSAEEMEFCLKTFGSVDVQSAKSNAAASRRVDEFSKGVTITHTPWQSRDESKYDAAMGHFAYHSDTKVYLKQTKPVHGTIMPPNPQTVSTYSDLQKWLAENVWDGRERSYHWLIRNGVRQVAQGNLELLEDARQQIAFAQRMKRIHEEPPQEWRPPTPDPRSIPVYAKPGALLQEAPPAAPSAPVAPFAGYLSPQEVDARIRAAQAEERQRIKAEAEAAEERRRQNEERQRFIDAIGLLRSEVQELKAGKPLAAASAESIKLAQMEERIHHLQSQLAAPPPHPAPAPPPATLHQPPPEPPESLPEPPEGYYLAWDYKQRKFFFAPKSVPATVAAPAPAPVLQVPPPPAANQPTGFVGVARQIVETANEAKKAAEMLVGVVPGVRLADDLAPPPSTSSTPAALAAPPSEEEKKEEKKPKVFHEEGGMTFRLDAEGNPITDEIGFFDVFANLGKVAEQGSVLLDLFAKKGRGNIEEEKARAELEAQKSKLLAEAEKAKAEAEKAKAEAEKAKAEAISAQQRALSRVQGLPVAPPDEEGLS